MASANTELDRFDDLRANGIGDNQAKSMVNYSEETFDERFDEFIARINARFDESDARNQKRFDSIDNRFEKIDNRFEEIDNRFNKIDDDLDTIKNRMSNSEKNVNERFDAVNMRIASRKYERVVITAAILIALIGLMPSIVETFKPFFGG